MYYLAESNKAFEQASADLESAFKRHGFGIRHVHNLGAVLRSKGSAFAEQCKIFDVCNQSALEELISSDSHQKIAVPCRITVFTESGKTKIVLNRRDYMTAGQSRDKMFTLCAQEMEEVLICMVNEAK